MSLEFVKGGRSKVLRLGLDRREGSVMTNVVWKCEQWFGGKLLEEKVFFSEEQARAFAKKLTGVAPDLVLKIEPMPVEHVWN